MVWSCSNTAIFALGLLPEPLPLEQLALERGEAGELGSWVAPDAQPQATCSHAPPLPVACRQTP